MTPQELLDKLNEISQEYKDQVIASGENFEHIREQCQGALLAQIEDYTKLIGAEQ